MDERNYVKIGIAGPVGSGKTALIERLSRKMNGHYSIGVITNDIYTKEDAEFLTQNSLLPAERIIGVETGGCPHTAIREDASMNLEAVEEMAQRIPDVEIIFIESGGDNLSATFSPDLADVTIFVIDVAEGDKIPRKGGPGITRSDLLVINKIDLAPYVGASLEIMDRDARKMRKGAPFVFTNLMTMEGLDSVVQWIKKYALVEPTEEPKALQMIARLHIQVALKNGKTFLKDSFHTQPFKLADITEDRNDRTLRLMIRSSSPGVLDNDVYKLKIELEEECSLELETQSYQRLFQMKTGAKQEMEVRMAKASSLIFLPHPSVPHEASVFSAKNKFYLSDDCQLIWGEVLTCGRKLIGEIFRFSKYHSQTEIFLSGKTVVKENLLIAPSSIDVNAIGQLEGHTHQATLICIDAHLSVNSAIENILEFF